MINKKPVETDTESPSLSFDSDTVSRIVVVNTKGYDKLKRCLDVIMACIMLILLMPMIIIIIVLILIDSPGASPFFAQDRVGKGGRVFRFYKFRSMVPNAEAKLNSLLHLNEVTKDSPAFKIRNDPRITRVGRFIRKVGLDEIPQLINVIRGDMSIVGPRPPLPREVAKYNEQQLRRLSIMPGITCYWQLQPHRNDLTFDEWMRLDIKYIEERSFLVDLKIMILTLPAMLHMYGI